MKLKIILAVLIAFGLGNLSIASQVSAANNDGLALDNGLQTVDDSSSSMSWPVLPHESLNDVARMFYPKNRAMQQQFVAKTLRLNAAQGASVSPEARSTEPTLLIVPTMKSLSYATRANNTFKNKPKTKKPNKQKMQMSYRIKELVESVPASLIREYEFLVSKNAFLKNQLDKLNKRLGFLQIKVDKLSLIFDKTFNYPIENVPQNYAPAPTQAVASNEVPMPDTTTPAVAQKMPPAATTPAAPSKKVFKNLSNKPTNSSMSDKAISVILQSSDATQAAEPLDGQVAEGKILNSLNRNLFIAGFVLIGLAMLGSHLLRKYRQRMYQQFSLATMPMDDSQMDFGGYWEDTKQLDTAPKSLPVAPQTPMRDAIADTVQLAAPAPKSVPAFLNTETRAIKSQAESSLQEAKLLMSANRSQDAIALLKQTIATQPKAAIEHWLYLLEIFKKQNLKADFESYAQSLHQTFNVMTPVWYESKSSNVSMIVPQYLEEFPHIMAKLYTEWPSKFAADYLRSLIADNREGIRAGFSKGVLDEILFLIALMETRKDFD